MLGNVMQGNKVIDDTMPLNTIQLQRKAEYKSNAKQSNAMECKKPMQDKPIQSKANQRAFKRF